MASCLGMWDVTALGNRYTLHRCCTMLGSVFLVHFTVCVTSSLPSLVENCFKRKLFVLITQWSCHVWRVSVRRFRRVMSASQGLLHM